MAFFPSFRQQFVPLHVLGCRRGFLLAANKTGWLSCIRGVMHLAGFALLTVGRPTTGAAYTHTSKAKQRLALERWAGAPPQHCS